MSLCVCSHSAMSAGSGEAPEAGCCVSTPVQVPSLRTLPGWGHGAHPWSAVFAGASALRAVQAVVDSEVTGGQGRGSTEAYECSRKVLTVV